jgi:hypothetical protein
MLIVYDTEKQKVINNMGTNSLFPNGKLSNLPELPVNQIYLRCHDKSELAQKIKSAHDYDIKYNKENEIISVTVSKTLQEYKQEQPQKEKEPTLGERIEILENEIQKLKGI